MFRAKDSIIIVLAVSSVILAVLVLKQQQEIQRLVLAANREPAGKTTVTIRSASQRSISVLPVSPTRNGGEVPNRSRGALGPHALPQEASPESVWRLTRGNVLARLMENPEFVHALERQHYAMLDVRFGGLFRELNLEPEILAAFKHLLVEKENVTLDVVAVSESLPDGPLSPETLRASVQEAQVKVEQAIHGSLGSERYAIYRDYEATLVQRATVTQLEQRLSYTNTPLTPPQAEALVRILSDYAATPAVETPPVVSVYVRPRSPEAVPMLPASTATEHVTDEVIVQSQTVLAPAQVQALRELQEEQQAAVRAAELVRQISPATLAPAYGSTYLLQ